MKKLLSILLAAAVAVPSAVTFAEDGNVPYEVVYDLNYENISSDKTNCWDYANGGYEGTRAFWHSDGFSGDTSIKMATNDQGYACFMPHRGWDGKACEIGLTEGKTYVMSFKIKKIPVGKNTRWNALRDTNTGTYIWGLGGTMGLSDSGWKSVSHTFTVGTAPTSTGDVLTAVPTFTYYSEAKGEDIVLIDDFRTVQINDTSVLNNAPTAEITGFSPKKMAVRFSREMSGDVSNPKAYIIGGAEAKSVKYDAKTRTAEVTPSVSLSSETQVSISACDSLGRAMNASYSASIAYDGTYDVKGFDYGEYDDEKYSGGGYDAGYDPDYDYTKDEQEVKYFIDENFMFNKSIYHQGEQIKAPSGWDVRNIGGNLTDKYFFHQGLIDTSDKFPVELNRKFENANHGRITLDFIYVPLENTQDGITFTLGMGGTAAVKYITRSDGNLYLVKADGSERKVGAYAVRPNDNDEVSWGTGEIKYNNGVRTVFNMDTKMIEKVFCDGQLVIENVPFCNDVEYVDNFNVNTGDENVGKLWLRGVKMYRGYLIHEQFLNSKLNVPSDYNSNGKSEIMYMGTSTPWDDANLNMHNGAKITKYVDKVQGKQMVFEYHFYQPEKNNGFEMSLKGNGRETIRFTIHDNKFWYSTNGTENELYSDYFKTVWYKIRAYMDLETKKATIYVNGIKKFENVDFFNDTIDTMEAVNNGSDTYVDFFRLWYDTPEPDDYCPEPQAVKPTDENMQIGMQFCPMWRNGYHVGWDSLNMDKRRVPYLGYYDEGDPEVNDWMIKQLVEHGFTFQRVTVIADTPGPYANPTFGWSFIDEGLKYAKYKSMLPYCVLLETGSVYHPTREYFLEQYLPYLIEHYFKDPDYLRIDGRPVLSCWTPANFFKYAGTAADEKTPLKDKIPLCQDFLNQIRQTCIDAGVGNPIIAMNLDANEDTLNLYKEIGVDCSMPYGSAATVEGQIEEIDKSVQYKDILDKTIALSPGLDGSVWQAPGNQIIEAKDYRKVVDHYLSKRNEFDENSLARNFICLDTYDEYGEGHWVAPSGGEGWGYLDAIYEAFCNKDSKNSDHDYAHQVPTTKQKDRFNNLYPPNRRLQTIKLVKNAPTTEAEGATVVKGYYFNNSTEGWNGQHTTALTVKDGCLTGSVTGNDSQLYSPLLDIDYHGLIQVKIRVKYNVRKENAAMTNKVFYICNNGKYFNEQQSVQLSGEWYSESGDDGFVDMIYPLAGSNLQSNLKQLRFDVMNHAPKDYDDAEFMIDSIELLYHSDYDTSAEEETAFNNAPSYYQNGGTVTALNNAPKEQNGEMYYPLREVAQKLGAKVDYDGLNDTTTVRVKDSGEYAKIYGKSQTMTVNGGNSIAAEPLIYEEYHTLYANERFFRQLFKKQLSFNASTRYITAKDVGEEMLATVQIDMQSQSADVSLENYTDAQISGRPIAAVYDSDVLKRTAVGSVQTAAEGGGMNIKAMDVSNIDFDNPNVNVKLFVFKDFGTLLPSIGVFKNLIINK